MSEKKITFNFGASLTSSDITFKILKEQYEVQCIEADLKFKKQHKNDHGIGWFYLPDEDTMDIKKIGEELRSYDCIVQIGIGGSSLGNLMLHEFFLGTYVNNSKSNRPDFYMADNPDPVKIKEILKNIEGRKTAFIVVSKSGNTAETMSQFLYFKMVLEESGSQINEDIIIITDKESGNLRAFANEIKCKSLIIPSNVGGRYSVLSAVGLLSAYALSIDIDKILAGAATMREKLTTNISLFSNPVWMIAALSLYHENNGRHMNVMMPYSSGMTYFTEWFAQLWSESLGKNKKGTTPVKTTGSVDQHSQVQLYTEGPDDKLFTIININDKDEHVVIPIPKRKSLHSLSYLAGWSFGTMLTLEAYSTASSIVKSGKPVIAIDLPDLSEETTGQLIFFYEYLTAFTGYMKGINPYDQPGVERGKTYTYGLMNRPGFEERKIEAEQWFKLIKSKSIII